MGITLATLSLSLGACAAGPTGSVVEDRGADRAEDHGSGFSAGVEVRPEASVTEIGLPVYPGAAARRDPDDSASGATLGLWGGAFGFSLRVLKFSSTDRPQAVADYYRRALGRYGPVLDCSASAASRPQPPGSASTSGLDCQPEGTPSGGMLLKAGRRGDYRLVQVKPLAGGASFDLLRIQAHAD